MSTSPTQRSRRYAATLKAICWGGFLGGCGDLGFAFVFYGQRGASMQRVMQSVAAGLLGKSSFEGGAATAALGVGLHYFIAVSAAATYVLASRRLPLLIRHAVPCGLVFGLAVYFVMNVVVLPLSALHTKAFPPAWAPYPMLGHIFLVGLPIALVARHYLARRGSDGRPTGSAGQLTENARRASSV